jgi:Subtilase family
MLSCAAVALATTLLSCTDGPLAAAREELALNVAPATDSVRLTYICGNMFRVRNSSFEPRQVRWDIYNVAGDTGSFVSRGRDIGAASVDFYVTSRTKGTMRLFVGGRLADTKANGNKVACAAPVDSTPLPTQVQFGSLSDRVVTRSAVVVGPDSTLYRSSIFMVQFKSSASRASRRDFQARFATQLVAVYPSSFQFRIAADSVTTSRFVALLDAMRADNAVDLVRTIPAFEELETFRARYPNDASGRQRSDYVNRHGSVWPATAIRLPQAWACETGLSVSSRPRIAVFEQNFPAQSAADLSNSIVTPVLRLTKWQAPFAKVGKLPSQIDKTFLEEHGHKVAGAISAEGDNGVGTASPLWSSDLRVLTLGNTLRAGGGGIQAFGEEVVGALIAANPRVLSLSSDFAAGSNSDDANDRFVYSAAVLKRLMDSLPNLLVIQAMGNDTLSGAYSQVPSTKRHVLQEGLIRLRDSSAAYRERIVFVGSSDEYHDRANSSNSLAGIVDIYAPGENVPVILPNGNVVTDRGTSFAAPLVAGVAGQLLTMDPQLSAAEVKQLLLDGARDPSENPVNARIEPARRVGNVAGTDSIFELDAFGSLRLLSARRPGTPLCDPSFAYWRNASDTAPRGWRAIRYGGALDDRFEQIGMPGRESGYALAPGGRLIATGAGLRALRLGGVRLRRLVNGAWVDSTAVADWDLMQFGEKDVLYARGVGGANDTVPDAEFLISGPGRSNAVSRVFGSASQRLVRIAMRPDGEQIAAVADIAGALYLTLHGANGTATSAPVLLSSASTFPQAVHSDIFWSPDSRGLVVTQSARNTPFTTTQAWGTNLKYFEVNSSGAPNFKSNIPTLVPIGQIVTGRWGAAGARFDAIGFRALNITECNTVSSKAIPNASAFTDGQLDHDEFCGEKKFTLVDEGGGLCDDRCLGMCCSILGRINRVDPANFPSARLRALTAAKRVNY